MAKPSCLVSPHVFACHVSFEDEAIQVGILILHEEFQPGSHFLYDIDKPEYPIAVRIDFQTSPQYSVKIPYASLSIP